MSVFIKPVFYPAIKLDPMTYHLVLKLAVHRYKNSKRLSEERTLQHGQTNLNNPD